MYLFSQSQEHIHKILQFFHFVIAKTNKAYIITEVLEASSNGRTRDFGSLYHGSNPCASTRINKNTLLGVFIYSWAHGSVRVPTARMTNTQMNN